MKTNIFEMAPVSSLSDARKKRDKINRFDARQEERRQSEVQRSEMFSQIDNAVASTLDFLVDEKGMDPMEAQNAILKHLSDIVMAHNIE